MSMRRFASVALVLAAVLWIASCSKSQPPKETASTQEQHEMAPGQAEHGEAGEHAEHGETDEHGAGESVTPAATPQAIWAQITDQQQQLEGVIQSGELAHVHHLAFNIRDLSVALAQKSTGLAAGDATKLQQTVDQVKANLDRYFMEMGTDYIDIVLLHSRMSPKWDELDKGLMDVLSAAKQAKKVRAVGISCHSVEAMKVAAKSPWLDVWSDGVPQASFEPGAPSPFWSSSLRSPCDTSQQPHLQGVAEESHGTEPAGRPHRRAPRGAPPLPPRA